MVGATAMMGSSTFFGDSSGTGSALGSSVTLGVGRTEALLLASLDDTSFIMKSFLAGAFFGDSSGTGSALGSSVTLGSSTTLDAFTTGGSGSSTFGTSSVSSMVGDTAMMGSSTFFGGSSVTLGSSTTLGSVLGTISFGLDADSSAGPIALTSFGAETLDASLRADTFLSFLAPSCGPESMELMIADNATQAPTIIKANP